ncbi:hypothetical protein DICSQDRAFT_159948 [Dichomitus squalens LYAD-421 SS1]|uniref:uncharacterized protein n=1 Tax=Dichomitus squalens (strain LYAD-421) TaxID=732165 RepID=UPI0004415BAE|nr:uncharacterized protein DICSQDRAFT_159948 [Dichomitus squalens LYAD-421 SS1]EJF64012.1 hypothetical protein DICSQDRAFT_159948 [Dichomitus squalens LYAD-421 SS1]
MSGKKKSENKRDTRKPDPLAGRKQAGIYESHGRNFFSPPPGPLQQAPIVGVLQEGNFQPHQQAAEKPRRKASPNASKSRDKSSQSSTSVTSVSQGIALPEDAREPVNGSHGSSLVPPTGLAEAPPTTSLQSPVRSLTEWLELFPPPHTTATAPYVGMEPPLDNVAYLEPYFAMSSIPPPMTGHHAPFDPYAWFTDPPAPLQGAFGYNLFAGHQAMQGVPTYDDPGTRVAHSPAPPLYAYMQPQEAHVVQHIADTVVPSQRTAGPIRTRHGAVMPHDPRMVTVNGSGARRPGPYDRTGHTNARGPRPTYTVPNAFSTASHPGVSDAIPFPVDPYGSDPFGSQPMSQPFPAMTWETDEAQFVNAHQFAAYDQSLFNFNGEASLPAHLASDNSGTISQSIAMNGEWDQHLSSLMPHPHYYTGTNRTHGAPSAC